MKLSDYDFDLPDKLIAQEPATRRDHSRLLVVNRADASIQHRCFSDVKNWLHPEDALVVNQTRVFPARLHGARRDTGGKVELLLIRELASGKWLAMGKPGRALQPGQELVFAAGRLSATVSERTPEGRVHLEFTPRDIQPVLDDIGEVPLPPYIQRRAGSEDIDRYQTVFARQRGAVAAPTAGLHFTRDLLEQIEGTGTAVLPILLHVGPGTFAPVRCEDPRQHQLEAEYFEVDAVAASEFNRRRQMGGRIIAVGTTVVRTLETAVDAQGRLAEASGFSNRFIYPPYSFRALDALVTNFHLPCSTLLMLVAAFTGYELLMHVYREAVREQYRFYSYGDAMLII